MNIYFPVDTDVQIPVNVAPLTDDSDFKTIEDSVVYNATGMALKWNFVTTAGVVSQTAVTPTTAVSSSSDDLYDWTNLGGGMYAVEIPAAGGGSANNDTAGWGYFSGVATGILPWRGPTIAFGVVPTNFSSLGIESDGDLTKVNALDGHTAQTGDSYAVVSHADYGNAKLVRSTTPANTLTVDASHLVAVPDTQKVDLETIKTRAVTCGAGVTVLASVGTATTSTAQTGDAYLQLTHSGQATYYVRTSAADDTGDGLSWNTAKKTIDAAKGSDRTIIVGPGTYTENLDWSSYNDVELILLPGAEITSSNGSSLIPATRHYTHGCGRIIQTGTSTDYAITASQDGYTHEGVTIDSADVGILCTGDDLMIRKCLVKGPEYGIALSGCKDAIIDGVNVRSEGWTTCTSVGILVSNGSGAVINNCTVNDTDAYTGAVAYGATGIVITGSYAVINGVMVYSYGSNDAAGWGIDVQTDAYATLNNVVSYAFSDGDEANGVKITSAVAIFDNVNPHAGTWGTPAYDLKSSGAGVMLGISDSVYYATSSGTINKLGFDPAADTVANVTTTGTVTNAVTVGTNNDKTGYGLADDAITAAKFDESTAFPLKSADTGATAVARTGADSDTLETLSDQADAIHAKTTNLPASPAATGAAMTLTAAYDAAKTAASSTALANAVTKIDVIDGIVDSIVEDTGTTLPASLGSVQTHGDSTWATATSVTVSDKTGFKLASDGLDSVSTTAPSGLASNFREMVVQTWRRWFKKSTLASGSLKTYADDGTTVATTQTATDDGTTQTLGGAS